MISFSKTLPIAIVALGMSLLFVPLTHANPPVGDPLSPCEAEAYRNYHDCTVSFPSWGVPGETCWDFYQAELASCDTSE